MKWLYAFVAIIVTVSANEVCYTNVEEHCNGRADNLADCNATFSGFQHGIKSLEAYANDQIIKSFEYLLLASNYGTYVKNRPGFAKQFKDLSDSAWNRGIDLIKHITKRGGEHNFQFVHKTVSQSEPVLELNEIGGMAYALDTEKTLATEAHKLHGLYSSHAAHKEHYDAEVAHYLEEKFIEDQASTVRKLSGHVNDLKKLLSESDDSSLSLYLFDEYLQKQ